MPAWAAAGAWSRASRRITCRSSASGGGPAAGYCIGCGSTSSFRGTGGFFQGAPAKPKSVSATFQPLMCVHCENAPCEVVCPVEATSHSPDGLNEMTYNRCVGARYSPNTWPYRAPRFNFLFYADYATASIKLQRNPEVTVRSRGVME